MSQTSIFRTAVSNIPSVWNLARFIAGDANSLHPQEAVPPLQVKFSSDMSYCSSHAVLLNAVVEKRPQTLKDVSMLMVRRLGLWLVALPIRNRKIDRFTLPSAAATSVLFNIQVSAKGNQPAKVMSYKLMTDYCGCLLKPLEFAEPLPPGRYKTWFSDPVSQVCIGAGPNLTVLVPKEKNNVAIMDLDGTLIDTNKFPWPPLTIENGKSWNRDVEHYKFVPGMQRLLTQMGEKDIKRIIVSAGPLSISTDIRGALKRFSLEQTALYFKNWLRHLPRVNNQTAYKVVTILRVLFCLVKGTKIKFLGDTKESDARVYLWLQALIEHPETMSPKRLADLVHAELGWGDYLPEYAKENIIALAGEVQKLGLSAPGKPVIREIQNRPLQERLQSRVVLVTDGNDVLNLESGFLDYES